MVKKAKAPQVTHYRGFMIVEGEGYINLIDSVTGEWMKVKSFGSAKWHAAIITRLRRDFSLLPTLYGASPNAPLAHPSHAHH